VGERKMRFLLIMTFLTLSSLSFAQSGDGTLPVIKKINVSFEDAQSFKLPKCAVINVNKQLKPGSKIEKVVSFDRASLKQKYTIKSSGSGTLPVISVKSFINGRRVNNLLTNMGSMHYNEISTSSGRIFQNVSLSNFESSPNGCVRK
jgi:hypothetical protein